MMDLIGHRVGTECLFLPLPLGTQWARAGHGVVATRRESRLILRLVRMGEL